jgi:ATP-dependent Lon protease
VLDPEQNARFRDNYLGVDFDLSKVMFITTANMLDTIPGPLRDRMEIIQLPGYTTEEKLEIAKRYLVKRQLEANGLTADKVDLKEEAIRAIIEDYTREAGVRTLERDIGAVLRNVAMRVAEGAAEKITVEPKDLHAILGSRKFESELAQRTSVPGVATGLAWTPVGGDILFIEASKVPGSGKLILTGQLGDVMKESAQAALTLSKSYVSDSLEKSDLHIHVPAGAIPKDGPSAGVTMATAVVSVLSGRPARHDVAMTGEITLSGRVLPIGGVKEKLLGAERAGITTIVLPKQNEADLEDLPEEVRARLEIHLVEELGEVLALTLRGATLREGHLRFADAPAADRGVGPQVRH